MQRLLYSGFKENYSGEIFAQGYTFGDADFKTQLSKIKGFNPDIIFVINYGVEGGLIAKQARELGINAQIIGSDNFCTPDVLKTAGKSVNGVLCINSAPLDETQENVVQFKKSYYETYGEDPNIIFVSANAYDTAKIIFNAIDKYGNDITIIKDYLYVMPEYNGVSGKIRFDNNGDATKDFVLQQIINGTIVDYNLTNSK